MDHIKGTERETETCFKPGPNDRNISTQHITTLLVQHLQAPAPMIATFEHSISQNYWAEHVARVWPPGWDVLQYIGYLKQVSMPGRNIVELTWANNCNIMQHSQTVARKFDHSQI